VTSAGSDPIASFAALGTAYTFTIPLFDEAWARRNLAFLLDELGPLLAQAHGAGARLSA